jgi:hypothetical protein
VKNRVRARAIVSLARIEALQLVRNSVVLGGLVAGGVVIWVFIHHSQPLWWNGDWQIGYGQVILSLTVLVAAQLATARSRRDGLAELYQSFPSSSGRRTLAHLIGVIGAVPASLVLIGAATAVFERRDVIGTPNLAVLISGILLVLAAGAIGVAIGTRSSHPLAGVLGAFVWFVPFTQSNRFSSAIVWLFPWVKPDQLNALPGPLAGYPPTTAHALELAAITVLAAFVALAMASAVRRQRVGLIAASVAAIAAIVATCVLQLQPIRTADLDHVVVQVANTGATQHCTTTNTVRYCLFPGFSSLLPSLHGPVNGVLARVPADAAQPLTISQASSLSLQDGSLIHGQSRQQVDSWQNQLRDAPVNQPSSTAVYVDLGSWPAKGHQADAAFDLALGTAEWAVDLPPDVGGGMQGPSYPQCVPLNQAREAIAIWLAAQATQLPSAQFDGHFRTFSFVQNTAVNTWSYPGESDGFLASLGPQPTAAGYLLAQAMMKLPNQHVAAVLAADWHTWISPHATDTQLARALGITMPAGPPAPIGPFGQPLTPPSGGPPPEPVCP